MSFLGVFPSLFTCRGAIIFLQKLHRAPKEIGNMLIDLNDYERLLHRVRLEYRKKTDNPGHIDDIETMLKRMEQLMITLAQELHKFVVNEGQTSENWENSNQPTQPVLAITDGKSQQSNHGKLRKRLGERSVKLFNRSMQAACHALDISTYPYKEKGIRETFDQLRRAREKLETHLTLLSRSSGNESRSLVTIQQVEDNSEILREVIEFHIQATNTAIGNIGDFQLIPSDDELEGVHGRSAVARSRVYIMNCNYYTLYSQFGFLDASENLRNGVHSIGAEANQMPEPRQTSLDAQQSLQDLNASDERLSRWYTELRSHLECQDLKLIEIMEGMSISREILETHALVKDSNRMAFFNWLSPLTVSFERKLLQSLEISYKQEGAAQLFLESSKYTTWSDDTGRKLWCLGAPGAGKTILASSVIQELQDFRPNTTALVYLYCDYSEAKTNIPHGYTTQLLGHVLRQLIDTEDIPDKTFARLRHAHLKSAPPSRAMCQEALEITANRYNEITIVIDGLDECPDETRDEIFESFAQIETSVRFLVTSRYKVANLYNTDRDIDYDIRALDSDIAKFVKAKLKTFKLWSELAGDEARQERVINGVIKRANGMFMLANLHTAALKVCVTLRQVDETLNALPHSLDSTYDQVLERLGEQNPIAAEYAEKLFSWICFAKRPLSVEEIQDALAIEIGDKEFNANDRVKISTLRQVCPDLLEFPTDEIVRFVHYSAQEYFTKRLKSAESYIAMCCMRLIELESMQGFLCGYRKWSTETSHFFHYVCSNWAWHAGNASDAKVFDKALDLCNDGDRMMRCIQSTGCFNEAPMYRYENTPTSASSQAQVGLWVAAFYGYYDLADHLLATLGGKFKLEKALMSIAVSEKHKDLVLLFAANGLDVNLKGNGATALCHAASSGDLEYASRLLKFGADITILTTDRYSTALSYAALNGQTSMLKLLLKSDYNNHLLRASYGRQGYTLLHDAVLGNQRDTIIWLLENGAEVNARDEDGETAVMGINLHEDPAAQIKLLVEYGADLNIFSRYGKGVLCHAFERGADDAFDAFCKYGASVDGLSSLENYRLPASLRQNV